MLSAGIENFDLTRYLVGQAMLSVEERIEKLRAYCPSANDDDWDVQVAGLRVQIIKNDGQGGGSLKFGTEVVTSADGSVAALLGASPGASTAVSIMIEVLQRCFATRWYSVEWRSRLAAILPSLA
jgi:malate dehydrogenase (quinone)